MASHIGGSGSIFSSPPTTYPVDYQATTWTGLFSHFFWVVFARKRGKLLLSVWATFLVWSLALPRRRRHPNIKTTEPTEQLSPPPPTTKSSTSNADIIALAQIIRPHLTGKFGALLALYVSTLSSRIFVTVKLADLGGELAGEMGMRRWGKMFEGQARFGLWCLVGSVTTAAMKVLEKQVALTLRTILFNHLSQKYLNDRTQAFAHQDLDDASARLTSDLTDFSNEAVHLMGFFLKPTIDTIHLSIVMAGRAGMLNLGIFYAFFVFADQTLKRIRVRALPRSLKDMALDSQRLDAELRERLSRLHHFREQIALQKGTNTERDAVTEAYNRIVKNTNQEHATYAFLDMISSYLVKYGGMMTAFSILTPSAYLDPSKPPERITGDFMANSGLLGALASAVKDIGDSLGQLPRVRGLARRVNELNARLDLVAQRNKRGSNTSQSVLLQSPDSIKVTHLTVGIPTPLDQPPTVKPVELTKDLTMIIERGKHLVIRGNNGTGKTSLVRTLTGFWEPVTGQVLLPKPLFVVPQDSYFVKGSLLEQITYPEKPGVLTSLERDEELARELLDKVGLEDISSRYAGKLCDAVEDWTQLLSGGQKQRLSFARLFYRARMGKAEFAFLDEPTSAISKTSVVELFCAAKKEGITLITVSHSDVVDAEHVLALTLDKGGGWRLEDVS